MKRYAPRRFAAAVALALLVPTAALLAVALPTEALAQSDTEAERAQAEAIADRAEAAARAGDGAAYRAAYREAIEAHDEILDLQTAIIGRAVNEGKDYKTSDRFMSAIYRAGDAYTYARKAPRVARAQAEAERVARAQAEAERVARVQAEAERRVRAELAALAQAARVQLDVAHLHLLHAGELLETAETAETDAYADEAMIQAYYAIAKATDAAVEGLAVEDLAFAADNVDVQTALLAALERAERLMAANAESFTRAGLSVDLK